MPVNAHSLFGPSKADAWANCHYSIAGTVAANLPDETPRESSASGTCTHTIAEKIGNGVQPESLLGTVEEVEGFKFKVDQDRLDRALFYTDFVNARPGMKFWEVTVDISGVIGVPDQSGTSDCVVVDLDTQTIEVHDLKDGFNPVSITTLQLVLYLLGAMKEFEYLCEFKHFKVFIHQPRHNLHDEHSYTRDELGMLQVRLFKAAQRNLEVMTLSPNKQLAAAVPGDVQCKWCRIKGSCPPRLAQHQSNITELPVKQRALHLTNEQLAQALKLRPTIEAFFKDVFAEAFERVKNGQEVPGWQLSRGRQGNRAWLVGMEETVADELYEVLEAETWTKSLVSPAEAEKALKRKKAPPELWAKISKDYITRSEAPLSLVPASAGAQAVSLGADVEFENVTANGQDLL